MKVDIAQARKIVFRSNKYLQLIEYHDKVYSGARWQKIYQTETKEGSTTRNFAALNENSKHVEFFQNDKRKVLFPSIDCI